MAAPGGSGGNDNVLDGLRKLYTQIASLQLLPDAAKHIQFLMQMQAGVMKYIQMQATASIGGGGQPAPGAAPMMAGAGGGLGGPGAAPGQQIAPGGGQGGMSGLAPQGPQAANDLRSLLAQQSGGG